MLAKFLGAIFQAIMLLVLKNKTSAEISQSSSIILINQKSDV